MRKIQNGRSPFKSSMQNHCSDLEPRYCNLFIISSYGEDWQVDEYEYKDYDEDDDDDVKNCRGSSLRWVLRQLFISFPRLITRSWVSLNVIVYYYYKLQLHRYA